MSIADELRKLLDENASLRERIHKLEMEGSDHFYRTAYAEDANRTLEVEKTKLQAEKAKLRELVDELYPLADYGAMDASELDRAHDLMRELGVEVGYER